MNKDRRAGIIQLLIVIVFIIGSFTLSQLLKTGYEPAGQNGASDRLLFVETALVTPQNYRITFETTGVVQARNEINVVPQVSGRVIAVNGTFFAGGAFKKGEVLFEIEPRDFQLDVMRLDAEVARASTALEIEIAESNAAISEWKQLNGEMVAPDLVARIPQMAEVRANLQSAQAQLENLKLDLERTRFLLPFDGRVLSSDIAIGQYVMAGQGYAKVFDISSLEIRASLVDRQLDWLMQTADPAIHISATYLGSQREYQGKLIRTASSLDVGTRFATVYFGFHDRVEDLLPGVFSEVKIKGSELPGITLLPSSALQAQNIVWRVTPENTLIRWEPEIIYQNDDYIAAKGLNETAAIVTSRISGATNGMRVGTTESPSSLIIEP
ncbi:MAG: efflux RND transporter periplasmic adaptor subunit [Gammaproteobacteria bacterium]